MARTEPIVTDAVLRWPCCDHCLPGCQGDPRDGRHSEPCPELGCQT